MIDDYVLKDSLTHVAGRALDFKKIVALPDREFSDLYLELMVEYRDKDGWWSEGRIPKCFQCKDIISGPQDLRRYAGLSMHPVCFGNYYEREEKKKGVMGTYWLRVADLILGPK